MTYLSFTLSLIHINMYGYIPLHTYLCIYAYTFTSILRILIKLYLYLVIGSGVHISEYKLWGIDDFYVSLGFLKMAQSP